MRPKKIAVVTFLIASGLWLLAFILNPDGNVASRFLSLANLILMMVFIWLAAESFEMMQTQKHQRPDDISLEEPAPTPNVAYNIRQLQDLGFVRLGEIRQPISGQTKTIAWILVSGDHSDTAIVFDLQQGNQATVEFNTVFTNNAFLQTSYPVGVHRNFAQLHIQFSPISVAVAYQRHVNLRSRLELEHGFAWSVGTMSEFLGWDAYFREHHLPDKFRYETFRSRMTAIFSASFIGFMLYGNLTIREEPYSNQSLPCVFGGTAILIVIGLVTMFALIPPETRIAFRRKPPTRYLKL